MTWKAKVIKLMDEKKMNQKDLARLSGITESSVSRYLHSEQRPRLDVIVNFARAFNVSPNYLLNDEDTNTENAYETIATAIARKGNELTPEEKNKLISLIIGNT